MAKRVLAFIFLFVRSVAAAQTLPVSIELMGSPTIETHTREIVSLVLKVSNRSAGLRTFSIDPALPAGWKGLFQDDWFYLDPNATEIKIASFLVPTGTPAGDYPIRCWLRDKDGIFFSTYCDLKVAVSKELSLDLVLLECPRYAIAGREYTAQFAVSNSGNADILADAAIKSSMSMPFEVKGLDAGKGTLLPRGAVKEFSVTVKTFPDLARSMAHQLQVDMRLMDAEAPQPSAWLQATRADGAKKTRAAATVELIPLSRSEASLSYTLPFTSTTSADSRYYREWSASLKETLKADGGLDEAGRHRIALGLAKRVGTEGEILLDQADRYSLEYSGPLAEAGIGDLSYGISPLLGERQFGRGAKAGVKLGAFALGALYFKDVWSGNGAQDVAASALWTAPPPAALPDSQYRIGLNFHSPLDETLALGILQEYSPFEGVRAVLDNAVQTARDGSFDLASYAFSDGHLGLFGWNARFGIGSPGFGGKFSDLLTYSLQAAFSPLRDVLTLRGGYSLRQENYLLDQGKPSAAEDARITAGIEGTTPRWKTALRFEWENAHHDDRLPALLFDSRRDGFKLTAKQPLAAFDMDVQAAIGIDRDVKTGVTSLDQDHRLTFAYARNSPTKASLQLRYAGFLSENGDKSDQLIAQAGLILPMGRAGLNITALNGYRFSQDVYQGTRFSLDAKFAYSFPNRQALSARAVIGLSTETEAMNLNGSLGIIYTSPFELPIGRKSNTAIVTGKILDAQSRLPVKGALFRLDGLAAISDEAGKFMFYVPHTGREYLFLESGSVGPGLVPMADMPMEVTLSKGEKASVEILLAKGCSISGRVSGYGFKNQGGAFIRSDLSGGSKPAPQREKLFDLPGMIVEASNGAQKLRKLTDANGAFDFRDLRPGKYSVRVLGGLLPEHFGLETDSLEIVAESGSSTVVEIKAIEEQRAIKMQEYELPVGN